MLYLRPDAPRQINFQASQVVLVVKNLSTNVGVWSLGQEDPLEEGMATHSNILAWRIPWTEEPAGLQFMGSQKVRHVWADTCTNTHTYVLGAFFFAYFSSFFYSTGLLNACCPLSLLTSCPKMLTGGRQTIVEGLLLCYFLYAHWPHENSKAFLLNRI